MRHPGIDGWLAVAGVVLIAEAVDTRTMSDAYRSNLRFSLPLTAYTVAHLSGVLPKQFDLFCWAAKLPIPRRSRAR
jgi:hypothetical protein